MNEHKKASHIKRPLNAFFVWSRLLRPKLLEQNPNISNVQVSVLLGKIWNEMSEEQKKPYYEESKRIKQQHRVDYPGWQFQRNPNPPTKQSKNKKYENLMKSSELGDGPLRNNCAYQIPQVFFIPSGQVFWPITHSAVPEARVPYYATDDPSSQMQSCAPPLYMGSKSCLQETSPYNDGYMQTKCSILPAYPYQQQHAEVPEYPQVKSEEMGVPENCLYKSSPFEVTSTQVKYVSSNTLVQENSHRKLLCDTGSHEVAATVSETLSETFEILYNKKTICVHQPETEENFEQAELEVCCDHPAYDGQPKGNPVVMTARIDNGREIISLPSILSKTEGMPGTLLHIPEQSGIHFERDYGFKCNNNGNAGIIANEHGQFENVVPMPLLQPPRDEVVESTEFLVEDSHLHAQKHNLYNTRFYGPTGHQNAPNFNGVTSKVEQGAEEENEEEGEGDKEDEEDEDQKEQEEKGKEKRMEDGLLSVFDATTIFEVDNLSPSQPYEERIHRAAEMLQECKSEIFNVAEFGPLDANRNWLGNFVPNSCSNEATFSETNRNTENEESVNLENISELSCFQMTNNNDNSLFDCLIPTCQSCVQIRSQIHLMGTENGQGDASANTQNAWTFWYDEVDNTAGDLTRDTDAMECVNRSGVNHLGHVIDNTI